MEKETIQVFEKEQQTSENKVDDLEKEITQGKLEERGQSENDSETVPEEPSPSSPEEENAPSQKDLLEKMMLMDQKLDSLAEKFDDKIQTDTYKNQLFDQMHNQLRKYQDDVLEAIREPIITELLDLLDGLKKYEKHMPEEATQENLDKMKKRFSDVREELEDILENMRRNRSSRNRNARRLSKRFRRNCRSRIIRLRRSFQMDICTRTGF